MSHPDITFSFSAQVSSYKQLKGGVIFVTELPKTASGKILRRKARGLYLSQGM
jgi:acyl-coenzyme A synthetase/AMP-(fatty) acid ligase